MGKKLSILFILIITLFPLKEAIAQEKGAKPISDGFEALLFEEIPIVYSGGFFARSITQAPGNVTVIKEEQFNNMPVRNLQDAILYNVPGVSEVVHENIGPMLFVRGVGVDTNAKTLFMLDGQHLNHRQHFGYITEVTPPLLGDISQIEVVSGPGAIVHGSGAISGFVNMIPKNGTDYPGFFTSAEWGLKEDLYKMEGGYGKSYGPGRDFYIYAGVLEAQGAKSGRPWPEDTTGAENDARPALTRFNIHSHAFPDPTCKIAAYWNHDNFSLNTFYREETMGINGTFYRWQGGGERPSWMTASLGIRPKYLLELNEYESIDFIGSALLMQQGHKGDSTGQDTDENDKNMDTENHFEFKVVGKTKRLEKHSTAAGFLLGRRGFKSDNAYFHSGSVAWTGEGQESSWNEIGLFAEDIMELTDLWTFSLGWRYDEVKYSPIESTSNNYQPPDANNVSWRAATSYEIDSTSNVKLSYQEGFRYLDLAYLRWHSYFSTVLNSLGYPSLPEHEPETMSSTELNYHKGFTDLNLKVDISLYHNVYDKMLHWHSFTAASNAGIGAAAVNAVVAQEGWMGAHINAPGKFRTAGFEIMGTWNPVSNMIIKLSYGYSVPTTVPDDVYLSLNLFTEDKNHWTFYPEHQVKAVIMANLLDDRLTFCLTPLYESAVRRLNTTSLSNVAYIYDHPRVIVDASVNYKIRKNLTAELIIKNLFEENVPRKTFKLMPYMGAVGDEERFWYLSLKYEF